MSLLAAFLTMTHAAAAVVVFGWLYWVVPRWKKTLDVFGWDSSRIVKLLISLSDEMVNYWYLLVPLVPAFLVIDFFVLRWSAKYLGILKTIILGCLILLLLLSNLMLGHYVLTQEFLRIQNQLPESPNQALPVEN